MIPYILKQSEILSNIFYFCLRMSLETLYRLNNRYNNLEDLTFLTHLFDLAKEYNALDLGMVKL